MEAEYIFLVIILLGLITGAVLGWLAFFRIGKLRGRVNSLQRDLNMLQQQVSPPAPHSSFTEDPAHTSTAADTISSAWSEQQESPQTEAVKAATFANDRPRWQAWH